MSTLSNVDKYIQYIYIFALKLKIYHELLRSLVWYNERFEVTYSSCYYAPFLFLDYVEKID